MTVENVKAFFKKIEGDETFRTRILKDERLQNATAETVLGVAKTEGFAFTLEELKQAQEVLKNSELNPDELEKVVGGAGMGLCFVAGIGSWQPDVKHVDGLTYGICLGIGINPLDLLKGDGLGP